MTVLTSGSSLTHSSAEGDWRRPLNIIEKIPKLKTKVLSQNRNEVWRQKEQIFNFYTNSNYHTLTERARENVSWEWGKSNVSSNSTFNKPRWYYKMIQWAGGKVIQVESKNSIVWMSQGSITWGLDKRKGDQRMLLAYVINHMKPW